MSEVNVTNVRINPLFANLKKLKIVDYPNVRSLNAFASTCQIKRFCGCNLSVLVRRGILTETRAAKFKVLKDTFKRTKPPMCGDTRNDTSFVAFRGSVSTRKMRIDSGGRSSVRLILDVHSTLCSIDSSAAHSSSPTRSYGNCWYLLPSQCGHSPGFEAKDC